MNNAYPFKALAVYCGSASPQDPIYLQCAQQTGEFLAKSGIKLIYGGGRLGLMGALADGALAAGGEVIGIIPEALTKAEVTHKGCSEIHVVADMHQRKRAFTDLSDGFLTLPGGVGTMDELWEAISWAQIGYHQSSVGMLNLNGFYDHLIAFHRQMVEIGFIRPAHQNILQIDDHLQGLLDKMAGYRPHRPIISMRASEL